MSSYRLPNPDLSDSVFEMFSMKGKVTIITGAAGGIGAEVAKALAEAGGDVALWYGRNTAAIDIAKEIEDKYKVKAKAYQVDVKLWELVSNGVKQVVKDFGHLDVMIANAGIPATAGLLELTFEEWDNIVQTDYNGVFYCARAAGQIFKEQGHGNLITTASMSGSIVNLPQEQANYNAIKAAVIHLTKCLAVEWAAFARCNSVSPGYIDTPISYKVTEKTKEEWYRRTPMRRDADPRELKGIYLYLASNASTFTTGSDFIVDGGHCCP